MSQKHRPRGSGTDLLLLGFPQHSLPHGPDDGDVLASCGIAVGLQHRSQRQPADHSLQNLSHVAEAQTGLRPGAGFHQLHGAGDQGDLTSAKNLIVNLGEVKKKTEMQSVLNVAVLIAGGCKHRDKYRFELLHFFFIKNALAKFRIFNDSRDRLINKFLNFFFVQNSLFTVSFENESN